MSPLAVTLVLASAAAHASWNLLAKNASTSHVFSWLCVMAAAIVTAPLAAIQLAVSGERVPLSALLFPAVSGVIHVAYFATLARAYRAGDLSLVYPIARGSAPLLIVALSTVIFEERPSTAALLGIGAILVGVACLTGDPRSIRRGGNSTAVLFAVATGGLIAMYTLWDKYGVSQIGVPPLLYFSVLMGTCGTLQMPLALRSSPNVLGEMSAYWRRSILAGSLVALAYVLVLVALVTSPVAYVAPMREIGILFGAVLGHRLLAEGQSRQRLAGSALMVIGVAALALG